MHHGDEVDLMFMLVTNHLLFKRPTVQELGEDDNILPFCYIMFAAASTIFVTASGANVASMVEVINGVHVVQVITVFGDKHVSAHLKADGGVGLEYQYFVKNPQAIHTRMYA